MIAVIGLTVLVAHPAAAAGVDDWTPTERAEQYNVLQGMKECVGDGELADKYGVWGLRSHGISASHASSGQWWGDGEVAFAGYVGTTPDSDGAGEGTTTCNDLLKLALSLWGYDKPMDLLCELVSTRNNGTSCKNGNDRFNDDLKDQKSKLTALITKSVWGGQTPSASAASKYVTYHAGFMAICNPKKSDNPPTSDYTYVITEVADDGSPSKVTYEGAKHNVKGTPDPDSNWISCQDIASKVNSYADDYVQWIQDNPTKKDTPSKIADSGDDGSGSATTCAVDNVGWIVCPVTNFLAKIADNAYGFLANNFLKIDTSLLNTDPSATDASGNAIGTGAYDAWKVFRTLANVVFVIVFLVIIYSQITGLGISNYGIKKLLPKLFIAAVLMNTSFWVCAIAVDVSNIVGYSLKSLFASIGTQMSLPDTLSATSKLDTGGLGLSNLAVLVLAAAATIYLMLPFLGMAIAAAVIALLMIGFVLILRKALIVILVVISPLAVAAYLLPNTDTWFKKWRSAFFALLMVFPVIGFVFGGAQLAGAVLRSAAGDDKLLQIVAATAAVLPLFIVPTLLKGSLNAVGNLGATVNKLGGKASGWAGKKGADAHGRSVGALANSRLGQNKLVRRIGARATGMGAGKRGRRAFDAAGAKYEADTSKEIIDGWQRDGTAFDVPSLKAIALSKGDSAQGRAALAQLAAIGEAPTLAQIRSQIADENGNAPAYYDRAIAPHYGTLKAKDPGAVKAMDAAAWAGVKQAEMHGMKDAALQSGAAASPEFRASLAAAMQDPEQARNFTEGMYSHLNGQYGMDVHRPAPASATPTTTPEPEATPPPDTAPATTAAFTREQVRAMSHDDVQAAVAAQGGYQALHDGDLLRIANAHGGTDAGTAARDEARRRGLIDNRQDPGRLNGT